MWLNLFKLVIQAWRGGTAKKGASGFGGAGSIGTRGESIEGISSGHYRGGDLKYREAEARRSIRPRIAIHGRPRFSPRDFLRGATVSAVSLSLLIPPRIRR